MRYLGVQHTPSPFLVLSGPKARLALTGQTKHSAQAAGFDPLVPPEVALQAAPAWFVAVG